MTTAGGGWYVNVGGQVSGPFPTRELQARAADGRVRPTDRVSPDGRRWARAGRVKGLTFPPAGETGPPTESEGEKTVESAELPLPGYQLLEKIGAGACGVVYRARQLKLDRVVALKTVELGEASSPVAVARFEKESVALARLHHPNIVEVYDAGHTAQRLFFAMELLEGEDLGQRIQRCGPVDERTAWLVARQVAAALAHAAAQGVYHRDVKPANLFLVPPPTGFTLPRDVPMVKVMDFGLALSRQAAPDERLTRAGVIVGTPIYMAPEQFSCPDVDHRADLYSLGATVFHALAGRPPFDGKTVWDVMVQKVEQSPRLGPPVSAESARLVADLMANEPRKRVAGYDELIARIDALPVMRELAGPAAPPFPPVGRPRWPRRRVAAVAGIAGLAVAAVAVALAGRPATYSTAGGRPAVEYVATGTGEELFSGQSALFWTGRGVEVETDDDKTPVLTWAGTVRRHLPRYDEYRLLLGLDLHEAAAIEVAVVPATALADVPRLAVRVSRDGGAVLGRRTGAGFEPLTPAVPYPAPAELAERVSYLEVRAERVGGQWAVWFRGKPVGTAPEDGGRGAAELRVTAEGGPVRVESARLEELRPK